MSRIESSIAVVALSAITLSGCLGGIGGSDNDPSCPTGFSPYTHLDEGFGLCYPNHWHVEGPVVGATAMFVRDPGGSDFADNVNIVVEDLPEGRSLPEVKQGTLEFLPNFITHYNLVNVEDTELGVESAFGIEYTGLQGESNLTWQQVVTIKEGRLYTWTYTIETGATPNERVEAEMRESFYFM